MKQMKGKITILICLFTHFLYGQPKSTVNRQEVIRRHMVLITKADSLSSLSVGNGQFAFTVDVTGLQSFPEFYKNGVPLGTQSEWGWHSFPNTERYRMEETMKVYEFEGRRISYPVQLREPERNRKAVEYFRVNPHRLQLGNLGLEIKKKDGSPAGIDDIKNIRQQLDLWTGGIKSNFTVENVPVEVITFVHQQKDIVAVKINSALVTSGQIQLRLRFPYPNGEFKDVGINYLNAEKHITRLEKRKEQEMLFSHTLDTAKYFVNVRLSQKVRIEQKQAHYYLVSPSGSSAGFEAVFHFSRQPITGVLPSFFQTMTNSSQQWVRFWKSGAAVDFEGSTDMRAFELERRIVLSQYLTRIQCASAFPPQETGLTYNSWYGKPHLEMHWWHAVHYALWGRAELMEKSLDWYFTVANAARSIAKRQGFDGLRWQKMTDHTGTESPSSVGSFLIWQQPHFIYMAELLYRSGNDRKVLTKYKDLVFATADFMASFPSYDTGTNKYNLGRGLIPAQERFDPQTTFNPSYELAYWHWALKVAQQWRIRTGLPRNKKWEEVITNLAPLPQKDNLYLATESTPDSYVTERYMTDHPAVLGTYASIPAADGLDTSVMRNTFDLIWKEWRWNDTWGWDFPLTAMTATRLHIPEKAIEALLMPVQTNTYLVNGHNYQDQRLTIYLPGNGGLLAAVAMMCAGFEGNKINNPGIPANGKWKIKWEGLKPIF
jgi:protein-glucosylgalactosylhydroxylysine glucosidase